MFGTPSWIEMVVYHYTYDELLYVRKHYLSVEALRNANGAVVNNILALRNPGSGEKGMPVPQMANASRVGLPFAEEAGERVTGEPMRFRWRCPNRRVAHRGGQSVAVSTRRWPLDCARRGCCLDRVRRGHIPASY